MAKQKSERNKKIAKMYVPGKFGYKKIAQKFGLSHITVRNILILEGVVKTEERI